MKNKLGSCWQLDTGNQFAKDAKKLEDLWMSMTKKNLNKIYCKGPHNVGTLILTKEELMDTINFLNTVKDMEYVGDLEYTDDFYEELREECNI